MVLSWWPEPFQEFTWFDECRWLLTPRPNQPTWVVSLPVGCFRIHIPIAIYPTAGGERLMFLPSTFLFFDLLVGLCHPLRMVHLLELSV